MRTTPSVQDQRIVVIFSLPPVSSLKDHPPVRDILQDIRELVDDLKRLGCLVSIRERQ